MFEVTVEDSFAAGHYLRNYRGKCENPHGHNYKVKDVTVFETDSTTAKYSE
jgi:6-pyruvoyl-tetrahydropterin synthase